MARFTFTTAAQDDLATLSRHIAEDSIEAADRVQAEILSACTMLSRFPRSGLARPDLTAKPLGFWTVTRFSSYVVIHESNTQPLQIIRIAHGKQDASRLL